MSEATDTFIQELKDALEWALDEIVTRMSEQDLDGSVEIRGRFRGLLNREV